MIIIEGKYRLEEHIGEGTFGKIYRGYNMNTGKKVAVKMESKHERELLLNEARIYVALHKCKGVSTLRSFGTYSDYNYIVVDLFEKDLEQVISYHEGVVPAERIFYWGHHILQILRSVHETGIVHRDIKPENVMVRGEKLYLVDFGLSRFYRDHSGRHNVMRTSKEMVGTSRYVSSNIHNGVSASRRDDIESLAYTLLFLCHVTLPWLELKNHDSVEQRGAVREMKTKESINDWCKMKGTPECLVEFIDHAKALDYDAAPDYNFFDDFKNIKRIFDDEVLCRRSPVRSDKSSGSTISQGTGSSAL